MPSSPRESRSDLYENFLNNFLKDWKSEVMSLISTKFTLASMVVSFVFDIHCLKPNDLKTIHSSNFYD